MAVPLAAVRSSAANSAVAVGLIGSGGRGTFDAGWLVQNPEAAWIFEAILFLCAPRGFGAPSRLKAVCGQDWPPHEDRVTQRRDRLKPVH
jgi:hypothetical protein